MLLLVFVRFWRERRKTEVAGDKLLKARKRPNIALVSGSLWPLNESSEDAFHRVTNRSEYQRCLSHTSRV